MLTPEITAGLGAAAGRAGVAAADACTVGRAAAVAATGAAAETGAPEAGAVVTTATGAPAAGAAALIAAGDGILMVGAAVGFGGKLMRTVSFFGCILAASAGLGGTAPVGRFGIFSAIIKIVSLNLGTQQPLSNAY